MITLVLGGARSGKSAVAEAIAARHSPVTYLATIMPDPSDEDLAARVQVHRSRRPDRWHTVEPPYDIVDVLLATTGTVLLDSLGPWLASHRDFAIDRDGLVAALGRRSGLTIIVSDEVGMGVHPETELGRRFRDELGRLNQAVAAVADDCLLAVAGRTIRLERP